jgi:hypothetical protein
MNDEEIKMLVGDVSLSADPVATACAVIAAMGALIEQFSDSQCAVAAFRQIAETIEEAAEARMMRGRSSRQGGRS